MKKLIILPAVTFILATALNAQPSEASVKTEIASLNKQESVIKKEKNKYRMELKKLGGKDVSYQAKQQFYIDFGDIPGVKWERTANFDRAIFTQNEQTSIAYYDVDANLVGTTTNKTFADLPSRAQKYINSKYPGYSNRGVIFFDDNELNETDMVLYNLQFEDADNYFVGLKKDNSEVILKVNMKGDVSFFKRLK
jgi:hypothetical protein